MRDIGYLLADCARHMRRIFDERMREIGVTGPQARLLMTLAAHEGEQQSYYANLLEVEPITLCRMVDRMVEVLSGQLTPDRERARTIATGGMAELIKPYTKTIDEIDTELTLTGLQLIYRLNCQGKDA